MPELPNDASIDQVAQVFGVADKLDQLTPTARQLTKGNMIAILGAENTHEAVKKVVEGKRPGRSEIAHASHRAGTKLEVDDVESIEQVFDSNFSKAEKDAMRTGIEAGAEHEGLMSELPTIYLCCCPCCCATTVLEPAPVVA